MNYKVQRGFTAVELLTCVALIAMLAAIAAPNFLKARTSSNIATARAEMQSIKQALEAYEVDIGAYPWMNNANTCLIPPPPYTPRIATLERLTTPIPYLTNASFYDPFQANWAYQESDLETEIEEGVDVQPGVLNQYFYHARNLRDTSTWGQVQVHDTDPLWYFLESAGPDRHHHYMWRPLNAMASDTEANRAFLSKTIYDPTNGSISRGSLWELGGEPQGTGTSMATVINAANSSHIADWQHYSK